MSFFNRVFFFPFQGLSGLLTSFLPSSEVGDVTVSTWKNGGLQLREFK